MTSVGNIAAETAKRLPNKIVAVGILLVASIVPLSGHAQSLTPSRKVSGTNSPNFHYEVVHGWPVLPENTILDEVSAVAVDSHDDVLVLQRGGRKWPDSGPLDESAIP